MQRRQFLLLGGASSAWLFLSGHSPYRRFQIYRKTRLIVMSSHDDPRSGLIADALATFFLAHWPDSKSQSGRARTAPEMVDLIRTSQLEVAVLSKKEAIAAREGSGRHTRSGKSQLSALAELGDHVLVTREDLLRPMAEKIMQALQENWQALDPQLSRAASSPFSGKPIGIPLHPVAAERFKPAI